MKNLNLEKQINKKAFKKIIKELFPDKIKWNEEDLSINYFEDTHLFHFDKFLKNNKSALLKKETEGIGFYVNEYELLHLLKEWIYSQGYEMVSGKSKTLLDWACAYDIDDEEDYDNYICILNFKEDDNGGGYSAKDLNFENGFMGKTELEAILNTIDFIKSQVKFRKK